MSETLALKTLQTSAKGCDLIRKRRTLGNSVKTRKTFSTSSVSNSPASSINSRKNLGNKNIADFLQSIQPPTKKFDKRDSGVGTDNDFALEKVDRSTITDSSLDLHFDIKNDQKSACDQLVAYMTSVEEPSSVEYLNQLAEMRRVALEDTLKENLKLCQEKLKLRQENLKLRQELADLKDPLKESLKLSQELAYSRECCRELEIAAEEGKELAKMLQEAFEEHEAEQNGTL